MPLNRYQTNLLFQILRHVFLSNGGACGVMVTIIENEHS